MKRYRLRKILVKEIYVDERLIVNKEREKIRGDKDETKRDSLESREGSFRIVVE